MIHSKNIHTGFTLVEILVVIAVIGILASISVVGYGAWKKTASTAQVKSDLNAVAAAMESARTFANAYPDKLPTSVTSSSGVSLPASTVTISDGITYCVDGFVTDTPTLVYYIDSETGNKGAQTGTCASRPGQTLPAAPTGLAMTTALGTQVSLAWNVVIGTTYIAQCASDPAFIAGMRETSPSTPSSTITGLTAGTTFYCRVKSVNASGSSAWSGTISTTTNTDYGSLAVATSIDGYWNTAPTGFLLENGAAVSRSTYAALFSVIGTTYGIGDGVNTFNLPDSQGRATVTKNSSDVEFATVGQKTGSKTEALGIGQIPNHSHTGTTGPGNAMSYRRVFAEGSGTALNHIPGWDGWNGYADYTNTNFPLSAHTHSYTTNATGSGATHNNIQPSIVTSSAIKYAPIEAAAVSLPAGTSIQGYWGTAPAGYALEDGSTSSRTDAAFGVIGTTYGAGNGSTTYNLPDSRGRVAVNKSTDIEFDVMGEKSGSKTEILTIAEIPSHTHTGTTGTGNATYYRLVFQAGGSTQPSHVMGWSGANGYADYNDSSYSVQLHTHSFTTNATGSNAAHNEIQPSIVKNSAIKLSAATATGTDVASGTSVEGYWSTVPSGYLAEDGLAVSRSTYSELFLAIGTTHGAGDGSTTFNVPNSAGRISVNKSMDSEFNSMGEQYGAKTVTLALGELPSHTHTGTTGGANAAAYRLVNAAGTGGQYNHVIGYAPGSYADYTDANYPGENHTHSFTSNALGGGGAHDNLQPSIVKMFAIKY